MNRFSAKGIEARRRLRDSQAGKGQAQLEAALDSLSRELKERGWSKQRIDNRLMKIRVNNIISNNRYPNRNNLLDLATNVSALHEDLPERLPKGQTQSMRHKRRPLYRTINGTSWRLAGTANMENTFAEQIAISKELAQRIRQLGAKARVVKWKGQVGVYYQDRPDPIATVFRNPEVLKTKRPTRFEHKPAIYGRKLSDSDEELLRLGFKPLDLPIDDKEAITKMSAFSPERRPEGQVRKLLVIWDASGMIDGTGVSMGWVTRAEAADLLATYGQYPNFSDFDKAYKEELKADQFDYSGLKKAEEIAKRREKLDRLQKERIGEGDAIFGEGGADISWQFMEKDRAELWPIIQQGYFNPPVGIIGEIGYDDLHNAFWDYLIEDGFTEAEVIEMFESGNISWGELDEWFEIPDMMRDTEENDEGEKVRERIEMNRIDGWRDGRFIAEYNDIVPIKSRIQLKDPDDIDLSKPGVEELGKKILWNMEFGNSDES